MIEREDPVGLVDVGDDGRAIRAGAPERVGVHVRREHERLPLEEQLPGVGQRRRVEGGAVGGVDAERGVGRGIRHPRLDPAAQPDELAIDGILEPGHDVRQRPLHPVEIGAHVAADPLHHLAAHLGDGLQLLEVDPRVLNHGAVRHRDVVPGRARADAARQLEVLGGFDIAPAGALLVLHVGVEREGIEELGVRHDVFDDGLVEENLERLVEVGHFGGGPQREGRQGGAGLSQREEEGDEATDDQPQPAPQEGVHVSLHRMRVGDRHFPRRCRSCAIRSITVLAAGIAVRFGSTLAPGPPVASARFTTRCACNVGLTRAPGAAAAGGPDAGRRAVGAAAGVLGEGPSRRASRASAAAMP